MEHLTIYHMHEIPKTSVSPNFAIQHGCNYRMDGQWDNTINTPLEFVVNPTGSGLTADEVIDIFDTAAAIIHDTVPKLNRRLTFHHLAHDTDYTPSLHKQPNITRVMDKVNQIGFSPRAVICDTHTVIAEAYAVKNRDTRNYIECDIALATDANVHWSHLPNGQSGNPNHWRHDHSMGFDTVSTALWALGHCLGLGPTDAHTHTMHGGSARGTFHKRSLECGDVNGLKSIYGR